MRWQRALWFFEPTGKLIWSYFEIMSGAFSIPFALLAKFADWPAWPAFAAIWTAAVSLSIRLSTLQKKQRPKLAVACSSDIEGCIKPAGGPSLVFRIQVRNLAVESIQGCQGRLRRIRQDEQVLWSADTAILSFAPGEHSDAASKTIYHDTPEYLDVVFVPEDPRSCPLRPGIQNLERRWPYSPAFESLFSGPGDYVFTIAFVAPSMATLEREYLFRWSGKAKTSSLKLLGSATD